MHSEIMRTVYGAVVSMALAACPAQASPVDPQTLNGDPHEGWLAPNVKWDEAKEVVIELGDNHFDPEETAFDAGKVYKLVLRNGGKVFHDLVENNFFHSVVTKSIVLATGTVRTPHIHSVAVQPGMDVVVYFAAVKPGRFAIYCSIPGHRENGMEGYFVIK